MGIYIVVASHGSWDSYAQWIHSVHLSEAEANEECERANKEVKDKLAVIDEARPAFAGNADAWGELDNEDDLTDEQLDSYYRWVWKKRELQEWNGAVVKPYEIGKIYDNKSFQIEYKND